MIVCILFGLARHRGRNATCFKAILPLQVGVDTMMHLTCTNMPKQSLRDALEQVSRSQSSRCWVWLVKLRRELEGLLEFAPRILARNLQEQARPLFQPAARCQHTCDTHEPLWTCPR